MVQELTLKTNHSPSYFNKDMIVGAMLGSLVAPVIGTLAGASIGGYIGKNTQEKENRTGKKVNDEPSFWNKDTLIGGFVGNFVGSIVAAVAFTALTGAAVTTAAIAAAPVAAVVAATAAIGITVAGAYMGGKRGEAAQKQEFETARQQTVMEQLNQSVSPEVAQAVEYAMANDKTKNWAKEIQDKRAQAAEQGQHQQR